MLRNFVRLLVLIIVFAVVRSIVVYVWRILSQAMNPPAPNQDPHKSTEIHSGGELRKDPVCGTFVPVVSSIKKSVDGEVLHFCSPACRDKFRVA